MNMQTVVYNLFCTLSNSGVAVIWTTARTAVSFSWLLFVSLHFILLPEKKKTRFFSSRTHVEITQRNKIALKCIDAMMQLTFLQAEKCGERLLIGKRQRENETGIEFIISTYWCISILSNQL